MKNAGLDKPTGTEVYLPYRALDDADFLSSISAAVKTTRSPLSLVSEVRGAVMSIDPSLPLAKVRTMDDVVAAATARPRFLVAILTMFSALALCLATVGIYGVISYSVAQRTTEFGIKLALGAAPSRLLTQVLGQGMVLAVAGIAVGIIGALFLTRSLEGLLFGISHLDAVALVTTALVLGLAAVVASCLPAIRSMRIQPVNALRYE